MSVENLDSFKQYIDRRIKKLNENSIKIYFEHQNNSEFKMILNDCYLTVLDNFREEAIQLINQKKRSFGEFTEKKQRIFSSFSMKCDGK